MLVNRIWLHHFGRGIVDTPGDFGMLGERPTHPELLDWLADGAASRQGWSLKRLHRLIMTSTVYRQSSRARPGAGRRRPGERAATAAIPLRRLEAEALRDRMLADGGPARPHAVRPAGRRWSRTRSGQVGAPDDKPRRSVYLQVRRSKPVAFLAAFDAPAGELNCDRRIATTAAPQSLMLMNSDFVLKQAGHFAARVPAEADADPPARTPHRCVGRMAWRARLPAAADRGRTAARRGVPRDADGRPARATAKDAELAALTNLCQQLLASNEFLYVD